MQGRKFAALPAGRALLTYLSKISRSRLHSTEISFCAFLSVREASYSWIEDGNHFQLLGRNARLLERFLHLGYENFNGLM